MRPPMTYVPRRPVRTPTIRTLQSDLDSKFGAGVIEITSWTPRQIAFGQKTGSDMEAHAKHFITGWFIGRGRKD